MTTRATFCRVAEASAVVRRLVALGFTAYLERSNRAPRGSYVNHHLLLTSADGAALSAATEAASVKFSAWRLLEPT